MTRILNQEELDKLVELGLLKKSCCGEKFFVYHNELLFHGSINSIMEGKTVEYCNNSNYTILPWMISENWIDTEIFR